MKIQYLKEKIWFWFVRKVIGVKEGEMYPFILQFLYGFIFPIRLLRWKLSEKEGYQPYKDTWIIGGEEYSGLFFRFLKYGDGKLFKVKRNNGFITIEEVKSL